MKPWRDRLEDYRRAARTEWDKGTLPAPTRTPIVWALTAVIRVHDWLKGPKVRIRKGSGKSWWQGRI